MNKRLRDNEDDMFTKKHLKSVISLPVEIITLISEFVQSKEFIMFSTLSKEVREYLFNMNIQHKGKFVLRSTFVVTKFDNVVIPFVTNLRMRYPFSIPDTLQIFPNSKFIDLSGATIKKEGAITMAKALITNKTLTILDLSGNLLLY
jgi:hypothetical protein